MLLSSINEKLIVLIYLPFYQLPDCDDNDDCEGDLICFERDGDSKDLPPGCGGSMLTNYDYCYDPFCEDQLADLKALQEGLSNEGLTSITFFDESIALLFGNGTTIGQVCAYAKGLELDTVDNVPGFCCQDAPYEAQDWGETVSDTCC